MSCLPRSLCTYTPRCERSRPCACARYATLTLSRDAKENFRRPGAFAESGAHPNLELVPPQSTIVQWLLGVRPAAFIDSAHVSTVFVSPCQATSVSGLDGRRGGYAAPGGAECSAPRATGRRRYDREHASTRARAIFAGQARQQETGFGNAVFALPHPCAQSCTTGQSEALALDIETERDVWALR